MFFQKHFNTDLQSVVSHSPDTDEVVSVTTVQGGSISAPAEGNAVGGLGLLSKNTKVGLELINNNLGLKIPDLDARASGSAEPVSVGAKDEGVDDITSIEGVEALGVLQVPEHGSSVLSSRGAEGTIGGDGDSVQVTSVSDEVGNLGSLR